MQCAVCGVQCAVCGVQCAVCSVVQCTLMSAGWGCCGSSGDPPGVPGWRAGGGDHPHPGWGSHSDQVGEGQGGVGGIFTSQKIDY